ncbi:MAG TPA: MarR family transcriptional regulator [Dongiaceae bacterium]|nr:MarR family transcriptional regulator [Dongiaceae bacterium]
MSNRVASTRMTDDPNLELDNQICFALYSTTHALTRAYRPILEALDLTYLQYIVMMVLWEQDGQTVKEIGQRLHLDSGTLTPLLKRLEAAELVRRQRASSDERQVNIYLTDKGKALYEKARGVPAQVLCASGQTVAQLMALKNDLVALRSNLEGVAPEDAA